MLIAYILLLLLLLINLFIYLARQPPVGHGLFIQDVSRSHTKTHHSRHDSSGRVISSSQRPLPDNTQNSQQTDIHDQVRFEPTISAGERPQTYALDHAATGTGHCLHTGIWNWVCSYILHISTNYVRNFFVTEILKNIFRRNNVFRLGYVTNRPRDRINLHIETTRFSNKYN
jgi:hypothetical protein